MLKFKQYINHCRCGVCLIKEIASLPNSDDNLKYYVLEPLFGDDKGSILRVPITNTVSLKPILSRKQTIALIKSMPKELVPYISDAKLRKTTYESLIGSGDIAKILPLLLMLQSKKEGEGHLNSIDNQFINKAEPIAYGYVATSLSIPYENVAIEIKKIRAK